MYAKACTLRINVARKGNCDAHRLPVYLPRQEFERAQCEMTQVSCVPLARRTSERRSGDILLTSVVILLLLVLKHDKEIILTEAFPKKTSSHNSFMILHDMELVLCNNARPSVAYLLF